MKKRKSCTLSQTRSPLESSPNPQQRARSASSGSKLPVPAAPSSRRGSPATGKRRERGGPPSTRDGSVLKTLESLFDLQKPFKLEPEDFLPEALPPPLSPPTEPVDKQRDADSSDSDCSDYPFNRTEDFLEKLKPIFTEAEPHLVLPHSTVVEESVVFDGEFTSLLSNLEKSEEEPVSSDRQKDDESAKMSTVDQDDKATVKSSKCSVPAPASPKESKCSVPEPECGSKQKAVVISLMAPSFPIPPCLGQGVVVGEDQRCDSMMTEIPLADACVAEEMFMAEQRANVIRKEIKDLKKIIEQLSNKEELSENDTAVLKDTQAEVMARISELNDITRKLQSTIGLVDPSTQTFARMFDMLPYPHRADKKKDGTPTCKKLCNAVGEKFVFPEIEYPEDKLPRVIICGNTEENIPKIVVADSRPKSRGKKCIQNLTGKLSESLTMQEKLAKENAQLEGGKYQLERELLEKDNAVDCLQRKICGLQMEMRMLMKENTELSRKLSCLAQQAQQAKSPCPPPPCPPKSPCLSPPQKSPKNDLSCRCSCKEPEPCPPVETPPGCGPKSSPCKRNPCQDDNPCKPKDPCPKKEPCPKKDPCADKNPCANKDPCGDKIPCREKDPCKNSPRLAGGASRGGDDCFSPSHNMNRFAGGGCCGNGSKSPPASARGGEGICPAEVEERLNSYGHNTKYLGEQLSCIEMEVRTLQCELSKMQKERQQLEQQRKLLECANPSPGCSCCPPEQSKSSGCPPPPKTPSCPPPKNNNQDNLGPCSQCNEVPDCVAQQLRDLREQYARLQDDYKNKLCEVSRLRADSECLRRETREAKEERDRLEIKLVDAQERLRCTEAERNELLGTKEQLVEQEQALLVARQRFREAQDELEELRTMIRDQATQLDDYRNKYLQAQQIVEEQKRQLDLMEMDNARMNENVTLEIGRVKSQFQEKLAELAPLPDILKQTQMKLQECQQMRMLAEHNCEDLSRELLSAKEKIDNLQTQIHDLQREIQMLQDEKNDGSSLLDELEKKNSELRTENEKLKNAINRFEEQAAVLQKRFDEKQHEIAQLTAMLEQVREDSARQVARTKERCEAIKRSMQAQISDFEMQLAQCRAAAKTAQKERDEIRHKMQGQIGNLNEALQQAQGRIRSLQGHVDYLKVSYSNVFGQGQNDGPTQGEPTAGYDTCDCNY